MIAKIIKMIGWALIGILLVALGISFLGYELPLIMWGGVSGLLMLNFLIYAVTQNLLIYVAKRVGEAIFVLFVIATLTFGLLRMIPGGPFDQEKTLPAEVMANIEAKYHLDLPLHQQYFEYMTGLMHGDLGESYKFLGRSVTDIISEALPASFQLGIFSLFLAYLIGIPLGAIAASKHNTLWDNFAMFIAISGVSLPSFLVAPILIFIFALYLEWVPPALWGSTEFYILPVITLGVRPAAIIARLTRASVLEVIHTDYIRTARAKGLSSTVVLFKHVLKNSLIPVLTFSGPLIAGVLSGSFIVELIFAIPGMAKHLISSVTNRDYPLILGATLVFSAILVLANLLVDLLYSYFDPRIKLS